MFVQTQSWSFFFIIQNECGELLNTLEVLRGIKVELEFAERRQGPTSSPPPSRVLAMEGKTFRIQRGSWSIGPTGLPPDELN